MRPSAWEYPTPGLVKFQSATWVSFASAATRFDIREVLYDPTQMQASAQRLRRAGLPMTEYPQTVPNLTASSTNLYELLKGRNLILYPDDEMRLALSRCVAVETTRGWRITKHTAGHKIDIIVALAFAALEPLPQTGPDYPPLYDVGFCDPLTGALLPEVDERKQARLRAAMVGDFEHSHTPRAPPFWPENSKYYGEGLPQHGSSS
jgi:Phage Terminase